jgi:hypothetical protein
MEMRMEIWSLKGEETPSLINESSFGCFLPLVTLLGHSLEWYFFVKIIDFYSTGGTSVKF